MDPEKSIILTELRDRYNQVIIDHGADAVPDVVEIVNDIVEDSEIIPQSVAEEIKSRTPRMLGARTRAFHDASFSIEAKWQRPLADIDKCLALADIVFARLSRALFNNGDVLRQKDPRPAPDRVTGAYVKCLLMLSLYGKSCGIATEISSLTRSGFPDAALSRLRTLHEHLVIIAVLHNDLDYEISEKYEDCSVFERLKQLKAEQRAISDPVWAVPEGYEKALQRELAKGEPLAHEIIARRGATIRKPYEWARQVLPPEKRDNPRYKIAFSDLEEAVGMGFFRGNYLTGNERIHAGSYSAVNYLNFDKPLLPQSRPRRDDEAIRLAGWRTAFLIANIARAVGEALAWETEEYDEFLYVCELCRTAYHVVDTFVGTPSSSSSDR